MMKIAVCGAGLIGVTTAHALLAEGIETVLIDAGDDVAKEGASFANAGSITVSRSAPWASPSTLLKAVKWLGQENAPLRFKPTLEASQWHWLAAFIMRCFAKNGEDKRTAMVNLAYLSQQILLETVQSLPSYSSVSQNGLITLYRTQKDWDNAQRDIPLLKKLNVECEALDIHGCHQNEPLLRDTSHPIFGGIRAPNDAAGDALSFSRALSQDYVNRGGEIRLGCTLNEIIVKDNCVTAVSSTAGERFDVDGVVVATGAHSKELLSPLGIQPNIYPVKGYSISINANPDLLPKHTLSDDASKVFLTPLDGKLRVAGVAELVGFSPDLDQKRIEGLKNIAHSLFPHLNIPDDVSAWTGLRGMTPDGPPILGPTKINGLHLNIGHGSLGWTLACGCARVVSDLIVGKQPALSLDHLLARNRS